MSRKAGNIPAGDVPLVSPTKWDENQDPTGWVLSENLEGVRSYYNGRGRFYLRNGTEIKVPEFIINAMPLAPTDGVFWCGYNTFDLSTQVLEKDVADPFWQNVTYIIYDIPAHHHLKYEERLDELKKSLPTDVKNVKVSEIVKCQGKDHFKEYVNQVQAKKGDGVFVRKTMSHYHESNTFYVYKNYQEGVAQVVSQNGSTVVAKLPNSKQINVTSKTSVQPGSIISFKYTGAADAPANATYHKTRPDLKWDEIRDRLILLYNVSHGKLQGPLPGCRGCKTKLQRGQLRLQASVMYTPPGSGPYPGKASFCLNPNCITQAIRSYGKKEVFLPPWDGRVGLDEDIKPEEQLPPIEGLTYIRET